jgi:AAA+ ATPase superfamily predicted ATPase
MDDSHMTNEQETEQNPFVFGKPVRISDFFNREELIEALLKKTVRGKLQEDVWITGERQVGKTSLLRYIHSRSKKKKIDERIELYDAEENFNVSFIYLNAQPTRTADDFYKTLHQKLVEVFRIQREPKNGALDNFAGTLKYLHSDQKCYPVFLVDEFDAFIRRLAVKDTEMTISFLSELNTLLEGAYIKDIGKIFGCIFTSNRTFGELLEENGIESIGSGYSMGNNIDLPWFTKEQIKELAKQYLKNHHIKFSDQDTDFCFRMTQGYPYFVQLLYYIMYKQKIAAPNTKYYLPKVKEEYGKCFKEAVKLWGGTGMPRRTSKKLKILVRDIIKKIGERSLSLLFKGIEEYIKTQMK